MQRLMHRWIIPAWVVVFAASTANCGREASSILAPSAPGESADSALRGGRGRPGGSSSLTLVMYVDKNGDGRPNWGDTVTFNVSTTATIEPTVELLCYQNAVGVYGAIAGFYDSYLWPWTKYMTLSSTKWKSGAAQCTATLFPLGARKSILAKLTFTAGA